MTRALSEKATAGNRLGWKGKGEVAGYGDDRGEGQSRESGRYHEGRSQAPVPAARPSEKRAPAKGAKAGAARDFPVTDGFPDRDQARGAASDGQVGPSRVKAGLAHRLFDIAAKTLRKRRRGEQYAVASTIHPTMRRLYHPAARLTPRVPFEGLDFKLLPKRRQYCRRDQ